MPAIKLFTPDDMAFVDRRLDGYAMPIAEVLLLNILIELRVQTDLMGEQSGSAIDFDKSRLDQTSIP